MLVFFSIFILTFLCFQDDSFKERVKADIEKETEKKAQLVKRQKQLEAQIENIKSDSSGILLKLALLRS